MKKIPIFFDSTSALSICHNPVKDSKPKHIQPKYHLIKDHIQDGNIEIHFVPTESQLADILTKALNESSFLRILDRLRMICSEYVLKTSA